ncbi:aspartate/glutamate racemase family protein [Glycomyces terrestris]|uniref:Aspartate/glutamate racemase family protein n=1 Tax=Glycomyces terrestris TaxID=2493553 RepID=A0A426V315_9ACTN|nr:aspartate/glutamate racemase family protein [Glycomyces terrestris]RRS01299.1 aspartate/glutamate racemase family protein [Glycomyces terrestris]
MRTIGLIGGMSWESSAEYYRLVNEDVRTRLGGQHNARSLMVTVDFGEIEAMQRAGDWDGAGKVLAAAAESLERGGADLIGLCTNTMHVVADRIESAVAIPFAHLVDATADRVRAAGVERVGLLATRFTMEMGFYAERMARHGIEVVVPPAADRTLVHDIIYGELTLGAVREESREVYRRVMADLVGAGCAGMIYGCTEITLLVDESDAAVPVFDSTRIHAEHLVDLALA